MICFANGIYSLINSGLIRWDSGFGESPLGTSMGYLNFSPSVPSTSSAEVIDELSTLLTSGRLSEENKQVTIEEYDVTLQATDESTALKVAQQLISSVPEFHTLNAYQLSNEMREVEDQAENNEEPYQAIVYIYLFGGMDSFYMLSPHTSCDLYTGTLSLIFIIYLQLKT